MNPDTEALIKADDGNFLTFWYDVAKNEHSSKLANRPIFDQVLKVRVNVPGDTKSESCFEIERQFTEVKDGDGRVLKAASARTHEVISRRYAREIASFKAKGSEAVDMRGTPINQWPHIDRRMAAELKAMHIHTVEALAALGDAGINAIGMGGRGLVEQAKNWLEAANGGAPISRLTEENESLKAKNEELEKTVRQLAARLDALEAEPEKRKPGRPRKDEAA